MPELIPKYSLEDLALPAWTACPAGLVLLGPEGEVLANPAARAVLADLVSSRPEAQDRWLLAAAVRLQASGRGRELLPGVKDPQRVLAVALAGCADLGWLVLAVSESGTAARQGEGLAETVSTLSHELRTPLASMKSSLNLVLTGETGPLHPDQEHFLAMTMRNIDRLDRLVSDLLDVARADAGQLNFRARELDAIQLVADAVDSHRQAARAAGLELDCRLPRGPLAARLDGDKVVQMISNLVGNALKYTPAGGRVLVRLEEKPDLDLLRLEVRDDGPGMDPATAERVLQPFHRAAAADRSLVPGSGLGLHITRRLAEAHGGRLGLVSRPGQGTLVWLELPRQGPGDGILVNDTSAGPK